jgi:hypothetical protein
VAGKQPFQRGYGGLMRLSQQMLAEPRCKNGRLVKHLTGRFNKAPGTATGCHWTPLAIKLASNLCKALQATMGCGRERPFMLDLPIQLYTTKQCLLSLVKDLRHVSTCLCQSVANLFFARLLHLSCKLGHN